MNMNRLFGNNKLSKKQAISATQHSLLLDDEGDDESVAFPQYRPPPATLLVQQPASSVLDSPSKQNLREEGGVTTKVGRHKSNDIFESMTTSPLRGSVEKPPRRFSSPDMKGKTSKTLLQNLKDRMKFNTSSTNNNNIQVAELEPTSSFFTPDFSEPFASLTFGNNDAVCDVIVPPASEGFTVCADQKDDTFHMNTLLEIQPQPTDDAPSSPSRRPKFKFKISSEPVSKSNISRSLSNIDADNDKKEQPVTDPDNENDTPVSIEPITATSDTDVVASSTTVALAVRIVKKHRSKEPKTPTKVVDESNKPKTPKTPKNEGKDLKTSEKESFGRTMDNVKTPTKSNRKDNLDQTNVSTIRTPGERSSKKTKSTKLDCNIDKEEDVVVKTPDARRSKNRAKSPAKDKTPKTPARTTSSDLEENEPNTSSNVKTPSKKSKKRESSLKSSRLSEAENVDNKDALGSDDINTKKESKPNGKESKSPSTSKPTSSRTPKKDSDSKKVKESKTKPKEKSKRRNSTGTCVQEDDKVKTPKLPTEKVSKGSKSKRRNSTGTCVEENIIIPKAPSIEPIKVDKSKRSSSTGGKKAESTKHRNSLKAAKAPKSQEATSPARETMVQEKVIPQSKEKLFIPDIFTIDDDVPLWVNEALSKIQQCNSKGQVNDRTMSPDGVSLLTEDNVTTTIKDHHDEIPSNLNMTLQDEEHSTVPSNASFDPIDSFRYNTEKLKHPSTKIETSIAKGKIDVPNLKCYGNVNYGMDDPSSSEDSNISATNKPLKNSVWIEIKEYKDDCSEMTLPVFTSIPEVGSSNIRDEAPILPKHAESFCETKVEVQTQKKPDVTESDTTEAAPTPSEQNELLTGMDVEISKLPKLEASTSTTTKDEAPVLPIRKVFPSISVSRRDTTPNRSRSQDSFVVFANSSFSSVNDKSIRNVQPPTQPKAPNKLDKPPGVPTIPISQKMNFPSLSAMKRDSTPSRLRGSTPNRERASSDVDNIVKKYYDKTGNSSSNDISSGNGQVDNTIMNPTPSSKERFRELHRPAKQVTANETISTSDDDENTGLVEKQRIRFGSKRLSSSIEKQEGPTNTGKTTPTAVETTIRHKPPSRQSSIKSRSFENIPSIQQRKE